MSARHSPRLSLPGGRIEAARVRDFPRLLTAGTALLGIAPPLMSIAARHGSDRMRRRLERWWARSAAAALSLDVRIDGLEHIDEGEPYVVAPLHEGFVDAIALLHLPLDLRFVARTELIEWRVLGRYLRASGQILVEPESPVTAYRRLLEQAEHSISAGRSPVIFPQGTILGIESAFSGAAFRVAERTGTRVLPIVLTGSHAVWDHPYSNTVHFGGTVAMRVLPPVAAEDAVAQASQIERTMKRLALAADPPPRRFVPERDGWWDDYRYGIDPHFPELAERVARHRERSGSSQR